MKGFSEMWEQSDAPPECLYGEPYTSSAYLDLEDKLHVAQEILYQEMNADSGSHFDSSSSSSELDSTQDSSSSLLSSCSNLSSGSSQSTDSSSESSSSSSESSEPHPTTIPVHFSSSKGSSGKCKAVNFLESVLETVVVPIIIYSDSTHLANFGDASLCTSTLAVFQNIFAAKF
jgi:hypothetical protein